MSAPTDRPEKAGRALAAISPAQWRQAAWISLGAVALYAGMRALPTGTNLHRTDFSVTGTGALEMCDPANPQFIPVVAARSPVVMTVAPQPDVPNGFLIRLATSSGLPIGPAELLVVHTRRLHLLIVDDTLGDYQHIHPEPTRYAGEWSFVFSPTRSAVYRVFADFTPVVTGRSLYASSDLKVERDVTARPPDEHVSDAALHPSQDYERDGLHFSLAPSAQPLRAGQAVDLTFTVTRADGGAVALEPVMGAFAHLVAFDSGRSGFAHLHPSQADPLAAPDAVKPRLAFKLTIPKAGRYVIWAQVRPGGHEVFIPFGFEVAP
jgi:hypothetical protein